MSASVSEPILGSPGGTTAVQKEKREEVHMEQLEKNWLTSQELVKKYGYNVSYAHASRAAKRIVQDYGLPYVLIGRKWRGIGE